MTSKQARAASAGGGQQAAAPGLANASVTQAVVTGQLEGTFVGNGCICSPACCRECIRPAAVVRRLPAASHSALTLARAAAARGDGDAVLLQLQVLHVVLLLVLPIRLPLHAAL